MKSAEPQTTMMDEDFLMKTAVEQLVPEQSWCHLQLDEVHISEIRKLCLDYKNIVQIGNMCYFTSLERLDLNNNRIVKIQGLDRLINLTWLNLSFNSIEKIEGLGTLQKLELLDLSNNRISAIENVDTLENITHFLIADNLIGELDNVLQVKKFTKLFTLNLFGNPVSEENDYKVFIAAHMPNLKYLDYRLLDDTTRNEAYIKYQYVIENMKLKELQRQQDEEAQRLQEAELKLHKDAFVESLNGSYLFKSMFKDDPEAETLRLVPEVPALLQTFEHQTVELCEQLFEMGLAEHKRREAEVDSFLSDQDAVVADYQQNASEMFLKFDEQHKESRTELQQSSDPDVLEVKIDQCNDEINQLCKGLMTLEFQLVSQLEDNIRNLERNISDMVGNFSETARGIFAQLRDLEDNYHQKVKQIVVATLEKVAKGDLMEDLSDDVVMLFSDKDAVMDALATCHNNHLMTINDQETQLVARVSGWKVNLIKRIQDKELKNNSTRISDTQRYVEHLREQLEGLSLRNR